LVDAGSVAGSQVSAIELFVRAGLGIARMGRIRHGIRPDFGQAECALRQRIAHFVGEY
jgi:hypothetical protein